MVAKKQDTTHRTPPATKKNKKTGNITPATPTATKKRTHSNTSTERPPFKKKQKKPSNTAASPSKPSAPDSNWKQLQAQLVKKGNPQKKTTQQHNQQNTQVHVNKDVPRTRVLAIDCEMVGVGPKGEDSRLARYVLGGGILWVCTTTHIHHHHHYQGLRS